MYSTTIALTLANTAYSIVTLARAARVDVACPGLCSQFTIEADRDNTVGSIIAVGDSTVTCSLCGYKLGVGDARTYDDPMGELPIEDIYVCASVAGVKLNVEVLI